MDSSPRTQVDLGQCLFRAIDSSLQLRFTATARISQQIDSDNTTPHIRVTQWQDLASCWVTEAPELDIRLFVRVASGLEYTCALGNDLGTIICNSTIWSDLGFVVRHKSFDIDWDVEGPNYRTIIGLCRQHTKNTQIKGRPLPAVLRNPPDAHAPPGVSAITLVSVDILLEYDYPPQPTKRFCDLLTLHVEGMMDFHRRDYLPKMEAFAGAAFSVTEREPETIDYECELEHSSLTPDSMNMLQHSSPSSMWLQLLGLGLQKLITSTSSRRPHVRTFSKEDTLQSLPRLFPAIFNPGYREAMNQRGASIPTISKSLASMFKNSNDPLLKDKVSTILQLTGNSSGSAILPQTSAETSKSPIESLLWRIAQDKVRHPKLRRGMSFFAPGEGQKMLIEDSLDLELLPGDKLPDSYMEEQVFAQGLADSELLVEDETEDMDLIEMDQSDVFYQHGEALRAFQSYDQLVAGDELELMLDW